MKKRIAVFCGSSTGKNPIYTAAAKELGKLMAESDIGLVYGGGRIGLMGIIADEVMNVGGEVIGVIPQRIKDMEVAHEGITELHTVDTMHKRKALMAEKADAFIAMPGGIGTLEEIIEVFTWHQLGYHQKPCALLNINGYFNHLTGFLDHMVSEQFLKQETRNEILVEGSVPKLIKKLLES